MVYPTTNSNYFHDYLLQGMESECPLELLRGTVAKTQSSDFIQVTRFLFVVHFWNDIIGVDQCPSNYNNVDFEISWDEILWTQYKMFILEKCPDAGYFYFSISLS